jgi:hypothetical protein
MCEPSCRNVSGRIQLWKDGEKEQLITECREETQAYLKAQLTRQPKKRTAEQAEDDRAASAGAFAPREARESSQKSACSLQYIGSL